MFPIQSVVPTRYPPLVNWGLIAANTIVFLHEAGLGDYELNRFLARYGLIPARLTGNPDVTIQDALPLFTNMFLHGGWLHLIFNMWTLWLFGAAIEDRLGHARYLMFYLACGLIASTTHLLFNFDSVVPALGASGAIAGVLGCYMRLFPLSRLVVMVPILFLPLFFEVPAFVFAGLWFVLQLIQGAGQLLAPSTGEGIAFWAHVGGFVAGFVLAPGIRRPPRAYRPYYRDEGTLGFGPWGHRGP